MTVPILQKVIVRMLFDPHLVDRVYDDPEEALLGLELSMAERQLLVRSDQRRWRADPLRSARNLHALAAEYMVSTHLYCHQQPLASLMPFYQSPEFHHCIMEGTSLAVEFGRWMMGHADEFSPMIKLETIIAERRRQVAHPGSNKPWVLSECVDVFHGPVGLVEAYETLHAHLPTDHTEFLARLLSVKQPDAVTRPWHGTKTEGVIVDISIQGGMGHGPPVLMAFLDAMRFGGTDASTSEMLRVQGIESSDIADVLAGLVEDGLIVHNS